MNRPRREGRPYLGQTLLRGLVQEQVLLVNVAVICRPKTDSMICKMSKRSSKTSERGLCDSFFQHSPDCNNFAGHVRRYSNVWHGMAFFFLWLKSLSLLLCDSCLGLDVLNACILFCDSWGGNMFYKHRLWPSSLCLKLVGADLLWMNGAESNWKPCPS